jgi:hypothetical protein
MSFKQLSFFVLFFFLFSCSNKKKEKTIDLSEITTSSERYKEGKLESKKDKKKKVSFTDTLDVHFKGILDSLKINDSVVRKLDIVSFPDRFGAKSVTKFYWKEITDSINFIDWEFTDSLKTENAFYNWIDCFGENCRSIKIGDKVKIQKRGLLVLVNEKHLIVIDSDKKIDYLKWVSLLKNQLFGENWKYIVFQPKKGKAVWMNYKNEVFTEINKQL